MKEAKTEVVLIIFYKVITTSTIKRHTIILQNTLIRILVFPQRYINNYFDSTTSYIQGWYYTFFNKVCTRRKFTGNDSVQNI